jgi:hypothetical protein
MIRQYIGEDGNVQNVRPPGDCHLGCELDCEGRVLSILFHCNDSVKPDRLLYRLAGFHMQCFELKSPARITLLPIWFGKSKSLSSVLPGGVCIVINLINALLVCSWIVLASGHCNFGRNISEWLIPCSIGMRHPRPPPPSHPSQGLSSLSGLYV